MDQKGEYAFTKFHTSLYPQLFLFGHLTLPCSSL